MSSGDAPNNPSHEGYETISNATSSDDEFDYDSDYDSAGVLTTFQRRETRMADRLSVRLLAVPDDDEEEQERILRQSLQTAVQDQQIMASIRRAGTDSRGSLIEGLGKAEGQEAFHGNLEALSMDVEESARRRIWTMVAMALLGVVVLAAGVWFGIQAVGPPNQPVGSYQLIERQEGQEFFSYYTFYEGRDSVGSAGYNMYVSHDTANALGIVNVTMEADELDVYNTQPSTSRRHLKKETPPPVIQGGAGEEDAATMTSDTANAGPETVVTTGVSSDNDVNATTNTTTLKKEPFIYMKSAPTEKGPRDSIRLEGVRRFDRGLFIIDVRHMPAGCGVWPAFWLTDEANWPVNGEVDILEGVNYQTEAKTALHATQGCSMNDIPLGVMTGGWDTAQGIPDAKTGIPDMTLRYARNCFVYDPHQWINQGCVAVDKEGGTIGVPFNEKGGGVYVLEWDPMNRHIRSWVFTPHTSVPDNLVDAIRTAKRPVDQRVAPDPDLWPTPYGYFAIGSGTDCAASHFRHMRIVFNTAFCGSVAGNRFHMDCKKQAKEFDTCNAWIKSEPDELSEAYWKIRGVYVYEREWERTWIN